MTSSSWIYSADSPTYLQWVAVELTVHNRKMVYIPEGVAHGFLTLTDDAELFYQISHAYRAEAACGVRWDRSGPGHPLAGRTNDHRGQGPGLAAAGRRPDGAGTPSLEVAR